MLALALSTRRNGISHNLSCHFRPRSSLVHRANVGDAARSLAEPTFRRRPWAGSLVDQPRPSAASLSVTTLRAWLLRQATDYGTAIVLLLLHCRHTCPGAGAFCGVKLRLSVLTVRQNRLMRHPSRFAVPYLVLNPTRLNQPNEDVETVFCALFQVLAGLLVAVCLEALQPMTNMFSSPPLCLLSLFLRRASCRVVPRRRARIARYYSRPLISPSRRDRESPHALSPTHFSLVACSGVDAPN